MHWIFACAKKAVMPKKKVIAARNLEDWTKFTTQINETTKKNLLNATILCCPESLVHSRYDLPTKISSQQLSLNVVFDEFAMSLRASSEIRQVPTLTVNCNNHIGSHLFFFIFFLSRFSEAMTILSHLDYC